MHPAAVPYARAAHHPHLRGGERAAVDREAAAVAVAIARAAGGAPLDVRAQQPRRRVQQVHAAAVLLGAAPLQPQVGCGNHAAEGPHAAARLERHAGA